MIHASTYLGICQLCLRCVSILSKVVELPQVVVGTLLLLQG